MLWYGVSVHILWGGLLLMSPRPANTTPLGLFSAAPHLITAALMLTAAVTAVAGLMQPAPGMRSLGLLLPQQMLLLLTAFSALDAVIGSAYSDGVIRSRAFIGADQLPIVIIVVMHTAALIEMHWRMPTRRQPDPTP